MIDKVTRTNPFVFDNVTPLLTEAYLKTQSPFYWAMARRDGDNGIKVLSERLVSCKDYVMDAAISSQCGSASYNDGGRHYMDTYTSVAVMPSCQGIKEAFLENIKILNRYEKAVRFKPTKIYEIEGDDRLLFVEGSVMWCRNSVLQSLWLSCVRMCGIVQDHRRPAAQTFTDIVQFRRGNSNETGWPYFIQHIETLMAGARKLTEFDFRDGRLSKSGGFNVHEHLHGYMGIASILNIVLSPYNTAFVVSNKPVAGGEIRRKYPYGCNLISQERRDLFNTLGKLLNIKPRLTYTEWSA